MSGLRKIVGKRLAQTVFSAAFVAASVALAGCAPQPVSNGPVAMGPLAPGQARIWFYRDYESSESPNFAPVELNGGAPIYVRPDGSSTYRDVAPGQSTVTVRSYGVNAHQTRTMDLAAGEEAFVKILSLRDWMDSGDKTSFQRDTFEVSLIPPQIARAQMAVHPFAGGS